jgi:hypothetical protein
VLASKHFGIRRKKVDDWFDPILNADTQLFVDPFLVFRETTGSWAGAHSRIISHFERAFLLIAEGNRNPNSVPYRKASALLVFTEPREFCLGYTARGTAGAGSGVGYARLISTAIADAIKRGLLHPRHFEELGILNEGIGADRISDITCTILKPKLIEYTQAIARRHGIPLSHGLLYGSRFDERRLRFEIGRVRTPVNPFTEGPLLFVPKRFLRQLPTLNAEAWWTSFENEQLRQDVNYEVMGAVDKKTIVAIARRNPGAVRSWMSRKEGEPASPYDLERDANGVWQWNLATEDFVSRNPINLAAPADTAGFLHVVESILGQFRLFLEDQGGWRLLWDKRAEKPEQAAQLLFRGIASHYAKAHDISLDAEVNLGRGPVDFKFSNGFSRRVHLEVKKLHNGKFWDGLERQLPSYMRSDEVRTGWLVALRYRNNNASKGRAQALPGRVARVSRQTATQLRHFLIDVRPKVSASKL